MKGETNFVADALSRPSVSAIHDGPAIDYKELSLGQAKDAEFDAIETLDYINYEFQTTQIVQ